MHRMGLHDGLTVLSRKALQELILSHSLMAPSSVPPATPFPSTSGGPRAMALCASSMGLALSIVALALCANAVSNLRPPKNLGKSALFFGPSKPTRLISLLPLHLHRPLFARVKCPLSSQLGFLIRSCWPTGLAPAFVVNGFISCVHKTMT